MERRYGSMVDKCDHIMNKAMRYFLGVHIYAATAAVQGDMGWLSTKYRRYIMMLKFWNRLIKMENNRLTKKLFLSYFDHPNGNWCNDIRCIATELDMIYFYDSMSLFNDAEVYQKCKELMSIEWFNESRNKPKLRTYCIFKRQFEVEPYVKNYLSRQVRSRLAQFRAGILPLHIETGRFKNVFFMRRLDYLEK